MSFKSFLKRLRKQPIACWIPGGLDGEGDRTYSKPIEIKGRWEDYYGEDADESGKTFHSRARVIVDRDLPLGSVLKLPPAEGTALENLEDPFGTDPFGTETDVYEVRKKETIPFPKKRGAENYHWTVVLSGRNN